MKEHFRTFTTKDLKEEIEITELYEEECGANIHVWQTLWNDHWHLRSRKSYVKAPIGRLNKEGRNMREAFDKFINRPPEPKKAPKKLSLPIRPLCRTRRKSAKTP